jgi:hypothetical protein
LAVVIPSAVVIILVAVGCWIKRRTTFKENEVVNLDNADSFNDNEDFTRTLNDTVKLEKQKKLPPINRMPQKDPKARILT